MNLEPPWTLVLILAVGQVGALLALLTILTTPVVCLRKGATARLRIQFSLVAIALSVVLGCPVPQGC